ncbi:MAG: isoleucine--tRNA ligase [Myxococcota bacterium]
MFEPVSPNVEFPELDRRVLALWDERQVFEKAVRGAEGKPPFVFYEGPPTANGMPHPGHVLTRVMKDVFLRYRTMCGYHVPRRGGWDTHGLPVEVEVEKDLGISGRRAIEEYGVEAFTRRCIDSVFRYIDEWRKMTRRVGFWVDLDAAYVTFHQSYVESVWWALSQLFERGLLYQDYKIVWWWPQGGTALSSGEVGLGYRTVDDPSIVVRFPVAGEERTSFLAWTTTPWTLPSNVALAVHPEKTYATVELEDGEKLILASALIGPMLGDTPHRVIGERAGRELVGATYEPPFRYARPEGGKAHVVVPGDFVTLDAGTGMVHLAPAFGEDDFQARKEHGLGFLQLVQPDGTFPPEVTDFAGRFCKEADRDIIRNLEQRGLLYREDVYRHEYPFSWRRDTDPLIQYARRSWFIRTTQEIGSIIDNNQHVSWEPEHIKEGRFGSFLRSNVDWALSRERFWGTPLPIWINDETGRMETIASTDEILERNPEAFASFERARAKDPAIREDLRVHKPWIDEVTWTRDGEPGVYRRVPDVIDCWFDSGCMPFAQWGYPHRNENQFAHTFPADFITEAVDQTRGWFYSLLTISTLMFPERERPHPFRNCVVLGLISDEKGQKLSKSKKNYTDPLEMMEQHGADAVRWMLYANTVPGQNTRFFEGAAVDALRDYLLKIWNVYSFFVTYANIDAWSPDADRPALRDRPDMDRWILAELDATVREVRVALDDFRSHVAARRLEAFVDALSNWYVRRSRERFWSGRASADEAAAFATLYEVLGELTRMAAPFVPFMAEAMYQNLRTDADAESVHLASYPEPDEARVDEPLRAAMGGTRTVVTLGQRVRAENRIKVRQPLERAIVAVADDADGRRIEHFRAAIEQELNVHTLELTQEPATYVDYQLVPNFRALGPKLGKRMPKVKKALAEADGSALHAQMEERGEVVLDLDDGPVTLGPDEVEVRLSAKEGYAAAAERGRVVVLDTHVDEELRLEMLAREVVNRIQRARKEADLPYEARIALEYAEAEGELARALERHRSYIERETLTERATAVAGDALTGAERRETNVEGIPFVFRITAVEGA